MTRTYTFNEVLDLIDQSTEQELTALCSLIKEEKSGYSAFHLRVIAAAVNIHLNYLQIEA